MHDSDVFLFCNSRQVVHTLEACLYIMAVSLAFSPACQPASLLAMLVCACFFIQFHRTNNSQSFDMDSIFHLSIVIISGSYSMNIVSFASLPWTHTVYGLFCMFIILWFAELLGVHELSISSNGISSSWNSFTLSASYVIPMAINGNEITNCDSNKTSKLMASFFFESSFEYWKKAEVHIFNKKKKIKQKLLIKMVRSTGQKQQ